MQLLSHSDFGHCDFYFMKGLIYIDAIEKSGSIRAGLQKGFQDGTSKMARRRCCGYNFGADRELTIDPDEAAVARWIFDRYLSGDSLGNIAAGLEQQGILFPTRKPKWDREAINKLISNEKYTGRVLLQKTVSVGGSQMKNDGFMDRYLCTESHEAIISDEMFQAAQQEKLSRAKDPEKMVAMSLTF